MKVTVCNICDKRISGIGSNGEYFLVDRERGYFYQIRQSDDHVDMCADCNDQSLERAKLMNLDQMREVRNQWEDHREKILSQQTRVRKLARDAANEVEL